MHECCLHCSIYPSSSCGLTMAESSRLTPWICMVWSPSACHHFKNWMLPCWNSREKISHFPPLTVTVDLSFGKCNSGRKMRVGAPEGVGESAVKDRGRAEGSRKETSWKCIFMLNFTLLGAAADHRTSEVNSRVGMDSQWTLDVTRRAKRWYKDGRLGWQQLDLETGWTMAWMTAQWQSDSDSIKQTVEDSRRPSRADSTP